MKILVALGFFCVAAYAQQHQRTTPVPILKQINRHNDDGSYSYGYEGADGTFKIETKYPTGEVYGKYGYVGDDGQVREIEYGATKRGFEPSGSGINVPPPTLNADSNNLDYDDGQYKEDPNVYNNYRNQPTKARQSISRIGSLPAAPAPIPAPAPERYNPAPARYNPAPTSPPPAQNYYNPPAPTYRSYSAPAAHRPVFSNFPATNVNLQTGSYSLSYSG